jgi:hypothetical protein
MSKFRFMLNMMGAVVFTLAITSFAQAQATRTWVSGVGDDVNPCSRTAPCKTFAGAISKTAKDGEIDALDPGGFGTITITKSITIAGDGTLGSILSALAPQGVSINITDPADVRQRVILRNLSINGAATGTDGVHVFAGKDVLIDHCSIYNLAGDGVDVNVTVAGVRVAIVDTNIDGAAGSGVVGTTSSGFVNIGLDNVRITHSGNGASSNANSRFMIRNSNLSYNNNGFSSSGSLSISNIDNSQFEGNTTNGIVAGAGTFVRISNNQVSNNVGTGVNNSAGASVSTYKNNRVAGNSTDTAGVLTDISATNLK